jgi:hypothetical protein
MNAPLPASEEFLALLDAACDGNLAESQLDQLTTLLDSDPAIRKTFINHVRLRTNIRFLHRAERACDLGLARIEAMPPATVLDDSDSFPLVSAPLPRCHVPQAAACGFFASGWPVAYLVATVALAVGLAIGALVHVSDTADVVRHSAPLPRLRADRHTVVGQITAMVDCAWSDPNTMAIVGAYVPLGRKYALASGLLEITYDTGAKVILQAPVTYEVESPTGGYLAVGKLTARLDSHSEISNLKSQIRNPQSPDLCPLTSDLFAIRTPTATITDLGTEFGVTVDRDGNNEVEVLQGEVRLQWPAAGSGSPREMHLGAGRSVRVDAKKKTVTDRVATPTRFVRSLTQKASQVISVNFTHGDGIKLDPMDRTGVLDAANWNNVDGSLIPAPTVELHDAAGKPTGANLTWHWSGAVRSPTYYNPDQMLDSRGRLLHDCFAGGTQVASLKIVVSNVPYTRYRAYVYYWSEPTKDPANLHTFGLAINGSKPAIISRPRTPLYHFARYQNETASGNYQVFNGLSGSLNVAATPIGPGKYHELFICGLQIVDTPGGE